MNDERERALATDVDAVRLRHERDLAPDEKDTLYRAGRTLRELRERPALPPEPSETAIDAAESAFIEVVAGDERWMRSDIAFALVAAYAVDAAPVAPDKETP